MKYLIEMCPESGWNDGMFGTGKDWTSNKDSGKKYNSQIEAFKDIDKLGEQKYKLCVRDY